MVKAESSEQLWKDMTPQFYEFIDRGQTLVGKLVGCTDLNIRGVPVKKWAIQENPSGQMVSFLGGVQLDSLLITVKVGEILKLEFTGRVKLSSGNSVKVFKLFMPLATG